MIANREPLHVVALSGGKDSVALALRLMEVEPRDYTYLITPTGKELPEMVAHWQRLETLLGKPLTRITNGTLDSWIKEFGALPSHRMRWCTRLLKIEPAIRFMKEHPGSTLYVGLRADEEDREGIYSSDVQSRFPMKEWGWGLSKVLDYLRCHGLKIPKRTDCAICFDQRLYEWRDLWREHPDLYSEAEQQEAVTGHTFRSPKRDEWPASLVQLRTEFERGRHIRDDNKRAQLSFDDLDNGGACRVCSL